MKPVKWLKIEPRILKSQLIAVVLKLPYQETATCKADFTGLTGKDLKDPVLILKQTD